MPQYKRKKFRLGKQPTLEDALLNEEERAMLYELDQSFLRDEDDEPKGGNRCQNCLHTCEMITTDKGAVSLVITFFIMVIGIALLVLSRSLQLASWVDELSRYVISAGVFGLASGGTNWIAVIMKAGESRQQKKTTVTTSVAGIATPHAFLSSPSSPPAFIPPRGVTRDLLRREEKMERQIQDLQVSRWKPPLIPDTINRMLLGMPCCLEWYKSMEEKRALLDAAVATYDGNCITAVLLFIRKTIDINLLVGMLLRRPIAAQHYCSLLKQLGAWNDVATIYRMLGDYESLRYLNLQQCEHWESPAGRVRKLKTCHSVFKMYPELQPDAPFVDEYCKLTEKQIAIQEKEGRGAAQIHRATSILFQPLTTTLLYCCRYHRNEPETHVASPEGLRKAFNISEKQFFQILLLALCVSRDWVAIDALFTSKGVFGISKKKKSPIGFERVVKTLASRRNRAPEKVITKYVMEIEDPETRLSLATEAEVFDVGIDMSHFTLMTLKQLKDRERLSNYISFIPSHRQQEFQKKIQTLLSNTQIRWK